MKRPKPSKKVILGLTGGVACGKTTVAGIFRSLGVEVIDADAIAHGLLKPGTKAYRGIVKAFGKRVLKKDRTIDRGELGRIVFDQSAVRRKLDRLTHPRIKRIIRDKLEKRSGPVILEAPLLLESGCAVLIDKLAVVKASLAHQIKRMRQRAGFTRKEALLRIRSQMPLEKKVRLADFVIDNNGSLEKTRRQAVKIWRQLWKS